MRTYLIRKSESGGKSIDETVVGVAALVLLMACGLAGIQTSSRTTNLEPSLGFHRERLHAGQIERLQTRDSKLEEEIKRLTQDLENTQADLASFRQVHDVLITQVGATTSRVQELEARLQDSKVQGGKLKEYAALEEQLKKERDEAVGQAQNAAERIRELTLQLQRAGVYP